MAFKETADFTLLTATKFMLGKWALNIKAIHALVTTGPFRACDNESLRLEKLKSNLDTVLLDLNSDFHSFVIPIAPPTENTEFAIVIRLMFKRYLYVVSRFYELFLHFYSITNSTMRDWQFMRAFMTPSAEFYDCHRSGIKIAADIPHYIFMRGVFQHILLMQINPSRPSIFQPYPTKSDAAVTLTLDDIPILGENKAYDAVLDYACYLSSFPVIPVDISGTLRPSMFAHEPYREMALVEPGIENRQNVIGVETDRVCIRCKTINQAIGQSDLNEQAKRVTCQCVMRETVNSSDAVMGCPDIKQPYLEAATTTRGTMIARLIQNFGGGCACKDHREIFHTKFTQLAKLVGEI